MIFKLFQCQRPHLIALDLSIFCSLKTKSKTGLDKITLTRSLVIIFLAFQIECITPKRHMKYDI